MKTRTILAAAAALAATAAIPAHAFCVYNKIDQDFQVQIRNGASIVDPKVFKGFVKNVKPGKSECCNYKNKECNHSGKRDSTLTLSSYYTKYHGKDVSCRTYSSMAAALKHLSTENLVEPTIQGGGYLTLDRNASFNASKPLSADNTPYVLNSWSYDDRHLASTPCSP